MTFHDEVSAMLVGTAEEDEAVFFVVVKESDSNRSVLCNVDSALEILNNTGTVPGIIKEFSNIKKGKSLR